MDENNAIKVLREVKSILDERGVRYWLDQGTLLGAVRAKKFIPWDDDIDIGTMYNEVEKIKQQISPFRKKGFEISSLSNFAIEIKKDSIVVDIYLFRIESDKAWRYEYGSKSKIFSVLRRIGFLSYYKESVKIESFKRKMIYLFIPKFIGKFIIKIWGFYGCKYMPWVVPKHYYEHLDKITFYDMEFNIPSLVKEYLSYKYGNSWLKPNSNYNYLIDDGAIEYSFKDKKKDKVSSFSDFFVTWRGIK